MHDGPRCVNGHFLSLVSDPPPRSSTGWWGGGCTSEQGPRASSYFTLVIPCPNPLSHILFISLTNKRSQSAQDECEETYFVLTLGNI